MNIFISHQKQDSVIASKLYYLLKKNYIDAYLDIIDEKNKYLEGEALTEHLKEIMNKSSDILVVMTENTSYSWWVPFEIGMAAQKNLRTVTYLESDIQLPDYLDYWPRLSKLEDIDIYLASLEKSKLLNEDFIKSSSRGMNNFSHNYTNTKEFYNNLKEQLNRN